MGIRLAVELLDEPQGCIVCQGPCIIGEICEICKHDIYRTQGGIDSGCVARYWYREYPVNFLFSMMYLKQKGELN